MDAISKSISVDAPVDVAFKVYVEEIDVWWPRQGKYRYTFAPEGIDPDRILFDAREGGSFYEVFSDGTTYEIGRVTAYEPPHRFVYTWKAPDWPADTSVEVTFTADGERTVVEVNHTGFESAGLPSEMASGYDDGLEEILSVYANYITQH